VQGHRVRAVNLDRKHGTSHSSSVPVGLLEPETATLDDLRREPAESETKVLFKEARLRRRRKRLLLGGVVTCLAFALVLTLIAVGGIGGSGGGPSASSHGGGRPGALAPHEPPSAVHSQRGQSSSGTLFCSDKAIRRAAGNSKGSVTLLPCYRVTSLPNGVATTTQTIP
jgi:hypothetical protein